MLEFTREYTRQRKLNKHSGGRDKTLLRSLEKYKRMYP